MSNENSTTNRPSKCREVILYPDDPIHNEYITKLICDNRCVGILHDKDIDDDGNFKKAHYHFIIKFDNTATDGTVLKILPDLNTCYIRYVKSEKGAMRYLIHADNPEKHQYNSDDLVGNKYLALKYYHSDDFEAEGIRKILQYLDDHKSDIINTKDIMLWCCNNDLYSVFRRSGYLMVRILEEHNKEVSKYWCLELIERAKEWGVDT